MKIALIRRQFSATGGAELYLQRLQERLAQQGHEVHLFAERWAGVPDRVCLHPVKIAGSRAVRPWRFAQAVQQLLSGLEFDCVFSLERTLLQDVYRAGDGVHRVWLERRRQFAPWWRRPLIGLGAFHRHLLRLEEQTFSRRNTRRVIVNSEMVRREILANFQFPDDRIHLVRNGIEVNRFRSGDRAKTRAQFGIGQDEYLLLFAGSGWERKGLAYVLAAMTRIQRHVGPDRQGSGENRAAATEFPGLAQKRAVKLLVVGKGRRPRRVPPGVIFAGPMAGIEHACAAANVLVFPPIYEPSSNVVPEALAAGLPVVTTAQNGAAEILEPNVTGTVLPSPADIDGMLKAIDYWAGQNRRVTVKDPALLDLDRNVSETLAILEQAAEERKR